MLQRLETTERCFVYTPVRIARGELLSLMGAAGFEVESDQNALWITAEGESRDIFVDAGDRFRIAGNRRVLISADQGVTIIVSGDASRATRIEVVGTDTVRRTVFPPQEKQPRGYFPEPVTGLAARMIPALAVVARLIGSGA